MKTQKAFSEQLNISVAVASGVEKATKSEFIRLGYGNVPAENGIFDLKGSILDVATLNVNLRTADRVFIKLVSFSAQTFDDIFDGVFAFPWENYLPESAKIDINGKCVKSTIFAPSSCQSIIKKAIIKRLSKVYKKNLFLEDGARYGVNFSLFKNECTIYLNTSGVGLHKRGYRDLVGIAPIKETLAAALLLYSDFYKSHPFVDPFTGSGTIAIEAAKIALNVAPNLERDFDFNNWEGVSKGTLNLAREKARDLENREQKVEIFASDIDFKAIKLAERHAERAGLKNIINFSQKDVKDVELLGSLGTVVTNPPYGERVYDVREAEECYRALRKIFKDKGDWSLFLITSHKGFEKYFGKKADRIRKLYNSNKECNYFYYYGDK